MNRCILLAFAALAAAPVPAQSPYDLILTGAHVVDPKNGVNEPRDVAIRDGRIAAVAPRLDRDRARKVLDVSGLFLTPALVDIHTHLHYSSGIPDAWAGDNSVPPDAFSFRGGVTTMVDAGSSGWRNFEAFRAKVIDRARTRVLALINIAGFGMISNAVEQGDFDSERVAELARKHADVVVGVKTAHYQKQDWGSVEAALEAGRRADIPIMVDFGHFLPQRPFWILVTQRLRPGDIATHMFRGAVPYVDDDGRMLPYLRQARDRGVKFDVGHGGGSFVLRNAVPAINQGFYPDSISTDLHTGSMNGAMMDMPTTMSKHLAMGMPLEAVVRASTWGPAEIISRPELGHLSVGATADVAVWGVLKGDFGFADPYGGRIVGHRRLICELTLKDGRVVWDWNARAGSDYKEFGPTYGIREGVDHIVKP